MAVSNPSKCKCSSESACSDGIDLTYIDEALQAIAKQNGMTRPKGFTVAEFAEKKKVSIRTAQHNLACLYQNGALERSIWRTQGKLFYVYRMKNGAKY